MNLKRLFATAAMVGAALAVAAPPALAADSGKKPNILFIMGDDIGWMQPSIYHRGLMVGETPNIDRIGYEGAIFMHYYAEQSCTAGRNAFFTGMHPLRTGMIPPQLPGSPSYLRPGTPASRSSCSTSATTPASSARTTWATIRRAADSSRLPGVLGLPLSPRRDAGREFPRHQQERRPSKASLRRARTRRFPVWPKSRVRSIPRPPPV